MLSLQHCVHFNETASADILANFLFYFIYFLLCSSESCICIFVL